MKVDKRYSMFLFAAFMSMGMSFSISLILTLINLGLVPNFVEKWSRAWIIGFLVSFPTSLIITPAARKITNKLTT